MSESKHTEGPWAWANGNSKTHKELYPSQFNLGEEDSILYHGADWGMKEADANLIAAAPELLAFVKYLDRNFNHILTDSLKTEIANLIAKTEGK